MAAIDRWYQDALRCYNEGEREKAAALCRRVIGERPRHVEALNMLGILTLDSGALEEALGYLDRAVAIQPGHAAAWCNRGLTLQGMRRPFEAVESYRKALALTQDQFPDAHNNLGALLHELKRSEEALPHLVTALGQRPDYRNARLNLGNCLMALDRFPEAIAQFETLLHEAPDHEALNSLGVCLMNQYGDLDAAIACYDQSLALAPDYPGAHWNRALCHLRAGRYPEGWPGFEQRFFIGQDVMNHRREEPVWNGEPLDGKTILVQAEQGFGDTFQFVRYLPLLKSMGARVVFECQFGAGYLLKDAAGYDSLIERGPDNATIAPGPYDYQVALLSLPGLLGTTLETIPDGVAYLQPDPERIERWGARLAAEGIAPGELKVGIIWAGNPAQINDRRRSTTLDTFAPLAQVPGVRLISLQKGYAAAQADNPPEGMALINLSPEIQDFSDTAAIMSELDLVISVCTSTTHLAGALGRPTWTLLSRICHWVWHLDRDDCPWYPTMRLFRQPAPGDWAGLIGQVSLELAVRRAERLLETGDLSGAMEAFTALADHVPNHVGILNGLGVCRWQAGEPAEALRAFSRALSVAPTDETTVLNCADVFRAFGQNQDADALISGLRRAA